MALDDPDFAQFVVGQQAILTRIARGVCLNWSDADEVVQECLVRVGLRWKRLIRSGEPNAYARTVVTRLAIDQARRRTREARQGQPAWQRDHATDRHWVEEVSWIEDALNSLSPNQRAAVALKFLADRTNSEIAAHLGCTEATVRSHVSRGIERLRSMELHRQEE